MKVVLAEKPSVAREIAAVLGADRRQPGYLEGGDWQVCWALGHLVELQEPHEYRPEWRRWQLEDLPLLPDTFALRPREDKGAQAQLKIIRDLFRKADLLVCATDAGREGELIFRYIQQWTGAEKKPFQRLWLRSLTPAAIREGFAGLRDGHEYDPLYLAARCRSEADWIIGLNATRYHTAKYGGRGLLWSVGRVQTPVLALVAERDLEIENFKPEIYWMLVTRYRDTLFTQPKRKFSTPDEAAALCDRLREHPLTVTGVERGEKRVPPPQLYDLSSLQQDMNTWFGFTAEQTLQAAQSLYEAKRLTYPRTDSRHIGQAEAAGLPDLLRSLPEGYQPFVAQLDLARLRPGKRVVDDEKVTDHHAILPTPGDHGEPPGTEGKVYAAVVRRLLAALFPFAIEQVTTVRAEVEQEAFQARGTVVSDWGWKALYPHLQKKAAPAPGEEEEADQMMPEMTEGESGPHEPEVREKTTRPPPRYTEATLLKRMETAGKLVDDEAMREAMKQRGLGTPATRAAILETLIARKYLRRQKKQLISTEAGRHLLRLVRDPALRSAELTGEWEAKLKEIETGRGDPEAFMRGIREQAVRLVRGGDEGSLGKCPRCGAAVVEGKRGFGCSRWKEGCEFVLWKESGGAQIDGSLARELLDLGHSLRALPVRGADGCPALARLTLSADGSLGVQPVAPLKPPKGVKSRGLCPLCGGAVIADTRGYACVHREIGCPLFIGKTVAKRKITLDLLEALLREGVTPRIDGFVSRAGKPFSARLRLEKGEVVMDFGT